MRIDPDTLFAPILPPSPSQYLESTMLNLVAYGTLMFPEVAVPIARIFSDGEPVTVSGFRRYEAKTRSWGNYPAIVADASGSFDGILFRELTSEQVDRLDWFECTAEGLYERKSTTIELSGVELPVQIYVCGPKLQEILLEPLHKAWNSDLFRRNELVGYLKKVVYPALQDRP